MVDKASSNDPLDISIPLHLRYLPPTNDTRGRTPVSLPYPVIFWACQTTEMDLNNNPFDRQHLGYDALFSPNTIYYHFEPRANAAEKAASLVSSLDVPVLNLNEARWVEAGTAVAVVMGTAWVMWKLVMVLLRAADMSGVRRTSTEAAATKKKV